MSLVIFFCVTSFLSVWLFCEEERIQKKTLLLIFLQLSHLWKQTQCPCCPVLFTNCPAVLPPPLECRRCPLSFLPPASSPSSNVTKEGLGDLIRWGEDEGASQLWFDPLITKRCPLLFQPPPQGMMQGRANQQDHPLHGGRGGGRMRRSPSLLQLPPQRTA